MFRGFRFQSGGIREARTRIRSGFGCGFGFRIFSIFGFGFRDFRIFEFIHIRKIKNSNPKNPKFKSASKSRFFRILASGSMYKYILNLFIQSSLGLTEAFL